MQDFAFLKQITERNVSLKLTKSFQRLAKLNELFPSHYYNTTELSDGSNKRRFRHDRTETELTLNQNVTSTRNKVSLKS